MLLRMSDIIGQLNSTGSLGGQTAPKASAHTAGKSAALWRSRSILSIVVCGAILLAIVIAATMALLSNLRDRDLAEKERALESLTSVLAEQIDRSFESIELVQMAVIERMRTLGIASAEDYERRMSGYDTYERLKDAINGLPYIDAIVLTDARGKLINFSRSWPIPNVKIPDNDPSTEFASDPRLISFVGKPLRSPATGNWVVSIARKLIGPNGEFLGVVQGAMELQYFEKSFGAIAIDPDSSIALFRRDGLLLARYPRQETAIGKFFPQSSVLKALATADHSTSRQVGVIDGQERLVSSRSLAHYPVAVVATVTVADALANWQRGAVAMIVAALMIGLVIGGSVFISIWMVGRKLREQSLQRDTALDNMSQGLAMFDAAARLVVCNDRYRQMYDFPPELVQPSCKLLDLLKYRFANGTFSRDPEEHVRDLPAKIAQGKMAKHVVETDDGRIMTVTNRPMANGGWVATHEDVTERIRAERLNEQQKLQLDTALDNMSQGLCMFDAMQRLIICNHRYAELYGLDAEQTKPGTTLRAILEARIARGSAPADHESYIKDRIKEVAENKPYQITNRLSDGRYIFVVHRPMANGGWVATHEDITERKQAEAEIEESHQNLARAETMANLGHYKSEQGSTAVTWSEGTYRVMGQSPASFTPTSISVLELIHPDDRPALVQYRRDVMTGLDLPPITVRVVRDDGQIAYVENWARPLRTSDGSVIGMFGTIQDVTDRKQAEMALAQANQQLVEKQYAIDQAVLVSNTDLNGNINYVNDNFCRISGYTREELLGQNHRLLNSGTHSKAYFRDLYRQIASGQVWRGEVRNKAKDGSLHWLDTTIIPQLGSDGKPVSYTAIRVDVTARKLAEEKISYMASHDALTGIGNRAVLHEKLEEALARVRRRDETFAVLYAGSRRVQTCQRYARPRRWR